MPVYVRTSMDEVIEKAALGGHTLQLSRLGDTFISFCPSPPQRRGLIYPYGGPPFFFPPPPWCTKLQTVFARSHFFQH